MFQPNLQAANGAALGADGAPGAAVPGGVRRVLRLPATLPAADWQALRARIKRLESLGLGIGTDVSTDLGDAIGTRGWWLGLGSCTALCGGALYLATMVAPLPQSIRPGLTPVQREAARPQAIAPLALGGVTGTAPLPSPRLVEALAEAPERPRLELTARISGGSFESVLRRAGVGAADVAAVTALVRPLANLGALPKGSDVDIVLGRRETRSVPRPLELLGFRAAFELRLAVSRVDGVLQVKRIPIAIDSTPLRITGSVGGNLGRTLRGAGIPGNLVAEYTKVMGYVVDFQRGVGKRDKFDIVVERDRAETGEVRYGALLFAGLDRAGKDPIELGRYDFGGRPEYFRSNGESARKGLMRTPVDGARLTSGFGMRFHPLLAYSRMHQGVDFGAPMGAPILAAAGGVVGFAGRHGGHGNYVQLTHNKELKTGYAHMSRFAVRAGQRVTQGQVIGYVGSTGVSTGPHLHYEVWLRGKATNPMTLKFIGGTTLNGSALTRFLASMSRLRNLTPAGSATAATAEPEKRRRRF
ncbi:MAG: peptidoglycan DD-metalloendopeptidase family protein [Polymorphobacter sp.]